VIFLVNLDDFFAMVYTGFHPIHKGYRVLLEMSFSFFFSQKNIDREEIRVLLKMLLANF